MAGRKAAFARVRVSARLQGEQASGGRGAAALHWWVGQAAARSCAHQPDMRRLGRRGGQTRGEARREGRRGTGTRHAPRAAVVGRGRDGRCVRTVDCIDASARRRGRVMPLCCAGGSCAALLAPAPSSPCISHHHPRGAVVEKLTCVAGTGGEGQHLQAHTRTRAISAHRPVAGG